MQGVDDMKKYDKYKDSGEDWLGETPETWKEEKVGSVTRLKSKKNQPDLQVLSVYRDYGVIKKDSRDDNHNATSLDLHTYKVVNKNDLVVNKMKAWQGSMGVSEYDGLVSPAYITCSTTSKVYPMYLHFLLRSHSYISAYNKISYGVRIGQWDMRYSDFKLLPLSLPDLETQERITDFIKLKTSEIDQAIEKKRKMIGLIKEQKTILINQAVTKGLAYLRGEKVKMKDSGVEWIGEMPEHWEVKKIKYIGDIVLGKMLTPQKKYGYVSRNYLKAKNVHWNKLVLSSIETMWFSKNELRSLRLKKDDLLICEGGEVGRTSIWKNELKECYIQNSINKIQITNGNPKFYLYLFMLYGNYDIFNIVANRVSIAHLTREKLKEVIVPHFSEKEQNNIVEFLDLEINKNTHGINQIEKGITKLQELKSTLISEVVTGKIKVN